ncbi:hypothetical protein C8R44DRAFT_818638 [Mycena epipterygia]|nr:hypothetical protein C8R44DRAFT_818638 [Mycena epipterygia]
MDMKEVRILFSLFFPLLHFISFSFSLPCCSSLSSSCDLPPFPSRMSCTHLIHIRSVSCPRIPLYGLSSLPLPDFIYSSRSGPPGDTRRADRGHVFYATKGMQRHRTNASRRDRDSCGVHIGMRIQFTRGE